MSRGHECGQDGIVGEFWLSATYCADHSNERGFPIGAYRGEHLNPLLVLTLETRQLLNRVPPHRAVSVDRLVAVAAQQNQIVGQGPVRSGQLGDAPRGT